MNLLKNKKIRQFYAEIMTRSLFEKWFLIFLFFYQETRNFQDCSNMTQGKLTENIKRLSQKLFLWGHFFISNFIAKYFKISRKRPKNIPKYMFFFNVQKYSKNTPKILLLYSTPTLLRAKIQKILYSTRVLFENTLLYSSTRVKYSA